VLRVAVDEHPERPSLWNGIVEDGQQLEMARQCHKVGVRSITLGKRRRAEMRVVQPLGHEPVSRQSVEYDANFSAIKSEGQSLRQEKMMGRARASISSPLASVGLRR
jgi:hypothetical protein